MNRSKQIYWENSSLHSFWQKGPNDLGMIFLYLFKKPSLEFPRDESSESYVIKLWPYIVSANQLTGFLNQQHLLN